VVKPERKMRLLWSLAGVLGTPLLWPRSLGEADGLIVEVRDPEVKPKLETLLVQNPNGSWSPAEVLVYERLEVVTQP
jgi:hypothetical protein